VAAILLIGLAVCLMPAPGSTTTLVVSFATETQRRVRPRSQSATRRPQRKPTSVYANFSHSTHVAKEKLTCATCHKFPSSNWKQVRKGDDAFPDVAEFPEHASCLSCHRQQFFARERPVPSICLNCHVKGTPADTSRYAFPSLGKPFLTTVKGENFVPEFRVAFPHEKHTDAASCADCHKTHAKGSFNTRPLTHANCFTCHNQESELAPLPQNCDTCHKAPFADQRVVDFDQNKSEALGVDDWWTRTAARQRISAGAFRHEPHVDLKCEQCHQVTTASSANTKVRVPVKSCGGAEGCHITATADDGGILNYEIVERNKNAKFVCDKCHLSFGDKPVPASHLNAIPKKTEAVAERRAWAHARPKMFAAAFVETDYSQFKHDNSQHARLPCLLCHRRENNSAQPTLPGKAAHAPCTGCHQQQFANAGSPICTICHTDVQSGKVKEFPPLRSFDVRFDHAKHNAAGAACATCHRRNRGGVGLSIPSRVNAHVTCYSCHTPNAQANGRNISSCSTCHQLGRFVRTSEQARAYRVGFSHSNHDASEKLNCVACHKVRAGLAQGRQVSAPLPLNHHAPAGASSCATCHNGRRAFGGDDFSVCKRCHEGSAWRF